MTAPAVKICGVTSYEAAFEAASAGADYLGFVFFRRSPRFITPDAAGDIIVELKTACFDGGFGLPKCVGLFVDAGEKELSEAAPFLTHFQFHGRETPERCEEMGAEFAVEVIKAIPIGEDRNPSAANDFDGAADLLLFDAKPPQGATRPGGHGRSFGWSALSEYGGDTPFFLAGGLTPDNVGAAIGELKSSKNFYGVDVSSGVEAAPGEKNLALIREFLAAVKTG